MPAGSGGTAPAACPGCACAYKSFVEEPLADGVGDAALVEGAADGDAAGAGVTLSGEAAAAGIGVGVGTKTVGIGEALNGGAEGSFDGAALGVDVCSKAVPTP